MGWETPPSWSKSFGRVCEGFLWGGKPHPLGPRVLDGFVRGFSGVGNPTLLDGFVRGFSGGWEIPPLLDGFMRSSCGGGDISDFK